MKEIAEIFAIYHHLWRTDDDPEGRHARRFNASRRTVSANITARKNIGRIGRKVGIAAAIHFKTLIPWLRLCNARARRAGEGIGHNRRP